MHGSILASFGQRNLSKQVKRANQRNLDDLVLAEDVTGTFVPPDLGSHGKRSYKSIELAQDHFNSRKSFQSNSNSSNDALNFNSFGSNSHNSPFNSGNTLENIRENDARAQLFYKSTSTKGRIEGDDSTLLSSENTLKSEIPASQSHIKPEMPSFSSNLPLKYQDQSKNNQINDSNNLPSFKNSESKFATLNSRIKTTSNATANNLQKFISSSSIPKPSIQQNSLKNSNKLQNDSLESTEDNFSNQTNSDSQTAYSSRKITTNEMSNGLSSSHSCIRKRLISNRFQTSITLLSILNAKIVANGTQAERDLNDLEKSVTATHAKLEAVDQRVHLVSEKATDLAQSADVATSKVGVLDDWLDGLAKAGSGMKIQLIEWGVRFVSLISAFLIVVWHMIQKPFRKKDNEIVLNEKTGRVEADENRKPIIDRVDNNIKNENSNYNKPIQSEDHSDSSDIAS